MAEPQAASHYGGEVCVRVLIQVGSDRTFWRRTTDT